MQIVEKYINLQETFKRDPKIPFILERRTVNHVYMLLAYEYVHIDDDKLHQQKDTNTKRQTNGENFSLKIKFKFLFR